MVDIFNLPCSTKCDPPIVVSLDMLQHGNNDGLITCSLTTSLYIQLL